jgi:hypothetical protein
MRLLTAACVAAIGLGSVASSASDDAQGVQANAEQVERLVDELGSARLANRLAAERALRELGPDALPELPPPDLVDDPGTRDALQRVRIQLEQELAARSLEASRVTFIGKSSIADTLKQIESQTGNRLVARDFSAASLEATLDVEWKDLTFWDAVAILEQELQAAIASHTDEPGIALVPASETERPAAAMSHGPWRVELISADIRPAGKMRLLRVRLRIIAEPRLRPLFADYRDAAIDVVTNGEELLPFNPEASRQPEFQGRDAAELTVDYLLPSRIDSAHIQLSGRIAIEVAAAPQEIIFRDLSGPFPVERRHGGVTVSLDEIVEGTADAAEQPASWARLRMSVRYDQGGPAFESHRLASLHREMWLLSPEGRRIPVNDGFEMTLEANGAVGVAYRFRQIPEDWRSGAAVYEAPLAIVTTQVPFELSAETIPSPEQPLPQPREDPR